MASNPGSTNGGTPSFGEPYTFPSFGNFGPPYVATLSLPGLTIGLPVWLFPTPVIPNPPNVSVAPNTLDVNAPPTHQPHVDFSPSSPIKSPSISPSSPSEISKASSQVDQKKKKRKEKKKKSPKRTKTPTTSDVGSKQPVTVNSTGSVDKIERNNPKPKFPCSLCKGDHFLRDCPGLTQVLEMWSTTSSASVGHVDDTPSTSDVKVGKKKKTVKFPCMLCKGNHYSHLCPRMDEASSLLEKLQLPKGYRKLSSDPSLVDGLVNPVPSPISPVDQVVNLVSSSIEPQTQVADLVPSSISPTLHQKSDIEVVYPSPPLVDPIQSSVEPTLLLESKLDTAHVFLVNTDSTVPGDIPPPPVEPPPSNEAILYDWGALTGPRLPSHVPFQITVQVRGWDVPQTLIDEGASVSILSSVTWYALGCPQLASVTQNLLAFNRGTSQPLGILPQFPVTLGGKTVFIDVMVVRDPLDFSLLLGRDYVYAMKAIVSTLFRVISFPHDGIIVTIDQLSCIGPDWVTSLSGSYMPTVSPSPHVNYVALSPMISTFDNLDSIVDMVISSVGLLELDLLTPVTTLDMCSFQSDSLPSDKDLLEAMTEFCPLTWYSSRALSSWKP
jgi:hypothetical protein